MGLDVRMPMGSMFSILGVILVTYGAASDRAIYARSLDVNVNLWWGLVIALTGGAMLALAWRAGRSLARAKAARPHLEG